MSVLELLHTGGRKAFIGKSVKVGHGPAAVTGNQSPHKPLPLTGWEGG